MQWSAKSRTSGFQRIRIFISSTLLCAPPKQRPCGDTETLNYSSSHSIKHEYQLRVPAAVIHENGSCRFFSQNVFAPLASTSSSAALFLTRYHGDKTWDGVFKNVEEEVNITQICPAGTNGSNPLKKKKISPDWHRNVAIVSAIFQLVNNRLLQRTHELPALIKSLCDGPV